MWRFVEMWASIAFSFVSWLFMICVLLFGGVAGAVVGIVPAILFNANHLRGLSVYQLEFWCPSGPEPNFLWQLWWCTCFILGITAAQLFVGSLIKAQIKQVTE